MPFDGSGNFSRSYSWTSDRDNGIKILASRMDAEFNNFATGMNVVFFRSGLVPMSGNLAMGSNYITGLGAGSEAAPSVRFADDATTGMWLSVVADLRFSIAGVYRAKITAAGLTVVGSVTATAATFSGTLAVTGASTLAAVAATTGAFSSNVTIGGTLGVTGVSTLAAVAATTGSFSGTLGVTGVSTLGAVNSGNLGVTGTLAVSGASTLAAVAATTGAFSSNVTVGGTLGVTGASALASLSATTGTFSGTLGVTGATTLSTLSVSGAGIPVTVNSTTGNPVLLTLQNSGVTRGYIGTNATGVSILDSGGSDRLVMTNTGATVTGTFAVSGASTLAALAATSGTFSGTLAVTGVSTLGVLNSGNTTVTGTLAVSGASTLAALSATTGAFSSNVTVGGTLGVTGASALNGGVTLGDAAGDALTVNSSGATIPNNLDITGGILKYLTEEVGHRNLPVNAKGVAFAFINSDRGKHIYYTGAAAAATIDPNATTAIDIGAAITIVNDGSGVLTITRGAGVALIQSNVDANVALAVGGMTTIIKVGTNRWFTR